MATALAAAVCRGPPGGTGTGGAETKLGTSAETEHAVADGKAKATMMWPGGLGGTVLGTLPLLGTVFGATLPLVRRIAVILPTPVTGVGRITVATTAVAVVGTVAVVGRMIPTSTETTSHAQQH